MNVIASVAKQSRAKRALRRDCFVATLLAMTVSTFASAANNFSGKISQSAPIEAPLAAPRVGEKLEYEVFWMGVPVGLGRLEVREKVTVNGREAYHLVAVAETNEFLSRLYPVHDEAHSFMDAEKLRTLEFRKTLQEGRYRADERIVYDYEANTCRYESLRNGTNKTFPIPSFVHDFLSAFYWFRLQPAKVGESSRTVVNGEEDNWDLEVRVLARETKELRGGKVVDTLLVEPKTKLKGMLYKRGRALVYFSSDSRRVPVSFALKTPFGAVVGVLKIDTVS